MPQRQRHLDEAGHSGRRLQVADVGLDRADQARAVWRTAVRQDGAQRVRLDRVAEECSGAVRFDVLGGAGRKTGTAVGRGQHGLLRLPAGCDQPVRPAILVDRGAADHGIDRVLVR